MEKMCIVCGQLKDIDDFPRNRRMPDGHLGWCMDCFRFRGLPHAVEKPARLDVRERYRKCTKKRRKEVIRRLDSCLLSSYRISTITLRMLFIFNPLVILFLFVVANVGTFSIAFLAEKLLKTVSGGP